MRELLGLPAAASVGFVTGCQMAHFTCLAAARHAVLRDAGWDVEADGLQGAPPVTVIAGENVARDGARSRAGCSGSASAACVACPPTTRAA